MKSRQSLPYSSRKEGIAAVQMDVHIPGALSALLLPLPFNQTLVCILCTPRIQYGLRVIPYR
jgi:hypothetical protein